MIEKKKEKIVTVRVPLDLHKRAAMKLAALDHTFQAVLLHAIEDFVAEGKSPSIATTPQTNVGSEEERRWVEALLRLLRSESPDKEKTLNVLRALLDLEPAPARERKQARTG